MTVLASCNSSGESSSESGLSLRSEDTLIVPDTDHQSIQFYINSASGDTFPNRVIFGVATLLDEPRSVAYSLSNDELYVCDSGVQGVLVYTLNEIREISELTGTANIPPRDIIVGLNTTMNTPLRCDVIGNELYVLDTNQVIVFNLSELNRLGTNTLNNLIPVRVIKGGVTKPLTAANDFAVGGSKIFIANQDEIHVYPTSADGFSEPLRVLTDSDDSTRAFHEIKSIHVDANFLHVLNKAASDTYYVSLYTYDDTLHESESSVEMSIHLDYHSSAYQNNAIAIDFGSSSKDFYVLSLGSGLVTPSVSTFSIYSGAEDDPLFSSLQGDNVQLINPGDIKAIQTSVLTSETM